ncbi:hypothetical protein [Streptomyces sp. NPDC059017]|uniref:hypothetical protein n=1 Tax=unclassified Streptomyces TaxID=2593676 RepID=UPI0036840C4F
MALALAATSASGVDPAPDDAVPVDDGLIHLSVGENATVDFGGGRSMKIEYIGHGFAVQGGTRPLRDGKLIDAAHWVEAPEIDKAFVSEVKADLATINSWGNGEEASRALPLGKKLLDFIEKGRPLGGDVGDSPRDYMFTNSEGKPYAVNVIVGKAGAGGNVHYPLDDARSQYVAKGGRKAGLGSVAFIDYSQTYSNFLDTNGTEIYYSPAQTLAHESGHAAHSIAGSRNSKPHVYQVKDPRTGKPYRVSDRAQPGARESVEESRTVGDALALMQFAGYKLSDAKKMSLPPFEGDTASVRRAVEEVNRLPHGTPEWKAAADAVGLRAGIAGINDKSLFEQAGLDARPHYAINPEVKYYASNGRVTWTKELQRSLPTATKDDGTPLFRPVTEREIVPSCAEDGLKCGIPASETVTAQQIKEGEKAVADYEEAVRAGSRPAVEPVDNKLIPELSPTELRSYAEARVTHAMAAYEAAPSGYRPGQFGFTSDLKVAMKNPGVIFQPFGAATSAKGVPPARVSGALTESWRTFNTALTPAMATLWINSIVEAFSQDASDLTKAAAVLAPVPVVGQLVGIADSADRRDGVGLAVNVLYLLATASEYAGQPELALLFGVAALVTQVIAGTVDWVTGKTEDARLIEGRNQAWHDTMKKEVIEKSVPELLSAAQKAFDLAQKRVMFGAYTTMEVVNANAAKTGSSSAIAAARSGNVQVMADAKASVQSLRSGFINGVHQAFTALFASLNEGNGADEFTTAYMDKAVWPGWSNDHIFSYCMEHDPRATENSCPNPGKYIPEMRAKFDTLYTKPVLADKPKNLFTAGDLRDVHDAVDSQVSTSKMFTPLSISDTSPVPPMGFIPCADEGGRCAGTEGHTGQVAFGAAGKYVTTALPPGGIACKPSSFSTDPNPSAHESCFVPAQDNASGGGGGSWLQPVRVCADEGGRCSVSGTQEVAFGTGANWIVKPVTFLTVCDSSSNGFGADPAPGKAKECRVLTGAPPSQAVNAGGPYQACAVQSQHCHVSGKVRLAFGAHVDDETRDWVYKSINGDDYPNGVPCTTSTFGEDPLPGERKSCYIANPPAQFTFCAGPDRTCSVPDSGSYQMAYGGDGSWVVKTVTSGNVTCNDTAFADIASLTSNDARADAHNYCYLSAKNHDLVLGADIQHEVQSVESDWQAHACARDRDLCKTNGPTALAYGTYEPQRKGTYLVRPFTPRSGESATLCSFTRFTPRDPQLNDAHCFLLNPPTPAFDPAQTDFVYRETKRTHPDAVKQPSTSSPRPAPSDPHPAHGRSFSTGFETDDTKPTWTDTVDEDGGGLSNVTGGNAKPGPVASPHSGEPARTGTGSLQYAGSTRGGIGNAHAYLKVFDLSDKPLTIGRASTLSYWIYPKNADRWDGMDWPVNNSNCVALDLVFTDGTTLRDSGAADQNGNKAHPAAQCDRLKPNEWNHITVQLTDHSGKEINRITLGYDQNYPGAADYSGYIDDIKIS